MKIDCSQLVITLKPETRMLQQFQLPPRPPFPKKATAACSLDEPSSKKPPTGNNKANGHKKSFSQGSVLEDQPEWLDDLLSDSDSNTQRRVFHCRSSSDPMASLYDLVPEATLALDDDDESSCIFSPNSPRRRVNVEFTGNSALAALSRYDTQMALPFFEEGSRSHERRCLELRGDGFGSSNRLNVEQIEGKRHPRQRSRVRKLQYIAELDRTVNDLQVLVSELQHKVSSLIQQHLTLSMENKKLKQQASKLQHQKLVSESEYQTLIREAERLKSGLVGLAYQKKVLMNHAKAADPSWEVLDWGKLNFG